MARPFLLVISFLVSSILPKYLQDFHASSPFLLMVYSSVLVSFTLRFLSLSFCGMVFFITSILCFDVDAHPVSSAYCWSMMR